ncbi:MAG: S8 family serine peptidase, partial [Candidatus Krumholzibacteria bacterium]|nr:S8 family serine peptidase [Candidatus Krumholzibacteria bacterium]
MRMPLLMTPVRRDFLSWFVLVVLLLMAPLAVAFGADDTDGVVTQRLQVRLATKAMTEETLPVWVYFTDRGITKSTLSAALEQAERNLNPRTAKRRAKVMEAGGRIVDERDLPVAAGYINTVTVVGAEPREQSRWFNAASFNATAEQIEAIAGLPFVAKVDAVAQGFRRPDTLDDVVPAESLVDQTAKSASNYTYDYGPSLIQAELANFPAAHDAGWTGDGVVIGVLDSGFRTAHIAFSHLNVIATYDFVDDDPIVDWEEGDPGDHFSHGGQVLSQFGAFSEGNLVGSAFNASVILARTEDTGDEQPIEEDYWVAGLEWVESLGADLVNSSLGYFYWYTYEDLDGDTALTSIAADMAAGRGMLVITSAGNERSSEWGWVTAPADADSAVAVGATYNNGIVAYFSSPGPTYDGRVKPDVMAMGQSNIMIHSDSDTLFSNWTGTSFASPITAGVAALVLEKHPGLTPMQVRDALRETADRADSPDNDYGWGSIDAMAALNYFVPKFSHTVLNDTEDQTGPYPVVCNLTDPAGLVPGSESLMVRFNGGAWQAVPLANSVGDTWTAGIDGQPHGTLVEYYLTANNILGETGVLPAGAPIEVLSFNVDIDEDSPVIDHTAIPDWPSRHWPALVT